jgi:ubiquinone/menaquinone biosynthesis C-methylase UbiE
MVQPLQSNTKGALTETTLPSDNKHLADQEYVRDQYNTTEKLQIRIKLHQAYTHCEQPWEEWVFKQSPIVDNSAVLEVGCGTGQYWIENRAQIPQSAQLTVTDQSEAMVQRVRDALGTRVNTAFRSASVDLLPYDNRVFDKVIAKHMLYHPKNPSTAISELYRVLKSGGELITTTNGAAHMREIWELARSLCPSIAIPQDTVSFSLENGQHLLESAGFDEIRLLRYQSCLKVPDPNALIEYVKVTALTKDVPEDEIFRNAIIKGMEDGVFYVTKQSGMFIAKKT